MVLAYYHDKKQIEPLYNQTVAPDTNQGKIMENTITDQRPMVQLRTNRGLLKFFLLSLITFGIYGLICLGNISNDINTIATKHDGKKTMSYYLIAFVFSWLTLGIVPLIWFHKLSDRIGRELLVRNLPYQFGTGTFWGWYFFGALLLGIGPLVYIHKLMHAMNTLASDYNLKG